MKRIQTIAILILFWICAIFIIYPVFAATEYQIPNSSIIVGVSSDVPINVSYSVENPGIGVRVYSDTVNSTWVIPPDKSPDGKMDIIVVPIKQPDFWSWLTSWL
jgi:hypothetical protein